MKRFRIAKDSLGEVQVPADALYGAQTQRAVENFPISGLRMPRGFIRALGFIKEAAAQVNADLGRLEAPLAAAIREAAREVAQGQWDDHFPVDVFQTGSGTSTNMNANEVIANRAVQILTARGVGEASVHPNDHVNMGQSSNDVIPSAIHIAAALATDEHLLPALETLRATLQEKAVALAGVIKTGRTHLMDALPIRMGQEFQGYVGQIERRMAALARSAAGFQEITLGGTAVGTGVNAPPEFGRRVAETLSALTGHPFHETDNHFALQAAQDTAVEFAGQLQALAAALAKIANDLRWMNSGPLAGLGEIALPAVQPGSSIMPGKINPVIAEAVVMVCAQVVGNTTAIALAGQGGNFELNTMLPLIAYDLLQSIHLLANSAEVLAEKAIRGLQPRPEKAREALARNPILVTALNPVIGYDWAAEIAKRAYREGRPVLEVALEMTDLSEDDLRRLLDPARMTSPC
jgi:fumarate hydratase class II